MTTGGLVAAGDMAGARALGWPQWPADAMGHSYTRCGGGGATSVSQDATAIMHRISRMCGFTVLDADDGGAQLLKSDSAPDCNGPFGKLAIVWPRRMKRRGRQQWLGITMSGDLASATLWRTAWADSLRRSKNQHAPSASEL